MPYYQPNSAAVVIYPKTSHSHADFPHTRRMVPGYYHHLLPHPESPVRPHGTSAPAVVYALGHHGALLASATRLAPHHARHMRDVAYHSRRGQRTLHVFGMLDDDAPYGSRATVENFVRHMRPTAPFMVLHLGVNHATPNEFRRGWQEIKSLESPDCIIGSLYPVEWVLEHGREVYSDMLAHPRPRSVDGITYPLREPVMITDRAVEPDDQCLVLNHNLHGQDRFFDTLTRMTGARVTTLPETHAPSPSVSDALSHNKHVLVVTNRPNLADAYAGSDRHHPYYEEHTTESAKQALEMLISPHFHSGRAPHQTIVLLDADDSPSIDWLLASYLRQHAQERFYCCIIIPHHAYGNLLLTNVALDPGQNYYEQLSTSPAFHAG